MVRSRLTVFVALAGLLLLVGAVLVLSPALRAPRIALARRLGLAIPLDMLYPGAPWAHVVPTLAPVDGVGGVRAADCGKCHERHYQEWQRSTHAHGYTDLQLQSELGKPTSPRWLCLNCHIPVENQREERIDAVRAGELLQPVRIANPSFDPVMREEGVTCAVCHVRSDANGRSYVLGSIELAGLTGGPPPPHPVRVDRDALVRRCYDCHDQTYQLTPKLTCYFQSGRELKAGPYAGDKECVSCHMRPEERPLVKTEGAPTRTAHGHGFIGGGVPKRFDLYDAQLALGYRPALDIDYRWSRASDGSVAVTVQLDNARAGHRAPTGDPERHYVIEVELLDGGGQVLARERLRIGQLWEWEPVARQTFDNRIAPREQRALAVTLRPGAAGRLGYAPTPTARIADPPLVVAPPGVAVRLRVSARHVRLSEENAGYMKRSASSADPRFAPEILSLERSYPFATDFFRSEVELATGTRSDESPTALMARSKARSEAHQAGGAEAR